MRARFTQYAVPGWGVGQLWTGEEVVLAHEFRFGAPAEADERVENGLVDRFRAFFAGEDVRFDDVPIDLDWTTPFQHAIATAVRSVPRGEVVSYGELAALAGYPGAARAAGTFCAHNRFMLILPCHRVVGASGIGGYGSAGTATKRRLLALEGIAV